MDAHLRDLRYFVAVAEELNFTRAADRLHLSQPALSKQIRGLETILRAQLFERDRRRVQLTTAGEALLAVARQLLADWDGGLPAVAEAAAEERRTLRVGTLTSLGRGLYPGIVERLNERRPGWRIDLRAFGWGDASAGLNDRLTDAALVWLPLDSADIQYEVLASERRFVAMSTRHALARRTSVAFDELRGDSFVALPRSAGPLRDFWLGACEGERAMVNVSAEATSADKTFEIISSGAAIALLAEGNAIVYSRPGIVCIPVRDLGPARLAVAWRRNDRRLAVEAFVEACLETARAGTALERREHVHAS